jgi:hypothetical protein
MQLLHLDPEARDTVPQQVLLLSILTTTKQVLQRISF